MEERVDLNAETLHEVAALIFGLCGGIEYDEFVAQPVYDRLYADKLLELRFDFAGEASGWITDAGEDRLRAIFESNPAPDQGGDT